MQKNNLPTLAAEAFEKSKPENSKHRKIEESSSSTYKLTQEGKFRQAQKKWIIMAKYYERQGDLKRSALLYFNGGDIKNAERAWNKAHKHI